MTIPVILEDGRGSGVSVKISPCGELITRVFNYSITSSAILNSDDTAFNLFGPVSKSNFIVTSIIISTNKDITINGTLVEVYASDLEDSTIISNEILTVNMLKNTSIPVTPLLSKIDVGKFLNVKHDDISMNAVVYCTVTGYFTPEDTSGQEDS